MTVAPATTHDRRLLPEAVAPAGWRASFKALFSHTLIGDDFSRDFDVEGYFGPLTPLGPQETWEDSPPGSPQGEPYEWWRRHDEHGQS